MGEGKDAPRSVMFQPNEGDAGKTPEAESARQEVLVSRRHLPFPAALGGKDKARGQLGKYSGHVPREATLTSTVQPTPFIVL